MQSIRGFCKLFSLVLAGMLLAASAQAATAYRPGFEKDRTVYTDPSAASNSALPVEFSGLAAELAQAGKLHDVTYYFVFIEETNENFNPNTNYALPVLKGLLQDWWSAPGFDRDRHILIVHVRKKGSKFGGKTAVEAGPALKRMGLTGSRFDERNGPVMTAVFAHMRNSSPNHRLFVLAIAQNCNADLTRYVGSQTPSQPADPTAARPSAPPSPRSSDSITPLIFGLLLIVLVGAIVLAGRWTTNRKHERGLLADRLKARAEKLQAFSLALIEFKNKMRSGTRPGDTSAYTGDTAAAEAKLASMVDDAFMAAALVESNLQEARTAVNTWWSLGKVRRLLNEPVVVKHGGSARYALGSEHHPQLLLEALNLFGLEEADKQFKQRLAEAKQYGDAVAARDMLKGQYSEAGLRMGVLQVLDTQLNEPVDALKAALKTDPVKAVKERQTAFQQLNAFNELLRKGLRTATRLPEIDAALVAANGVADTARKLQVDLNYPGKLTGTADVSRRRVQVVYHGDENPEACLEQAKHKLADARKFLQSGRTSEAEQAADAAEASCAQLTVELKALNQARLAVKHEVTTVEEKLAKLLARLEGAEVYLAESEAIFKAETAVCEFVRAKLLAARAAHDETVLTLKTCAEYFVQQRFKSAKTLLDEGVAGILLAEQQLSEAGEGLSELYNLKAQATEMMEKAQTVRSQLAAELPKGTTEATRKIVQEARTALAALETAMSMQPVSWRDAGSQAGLVTHALSRLTQSMAADKDSYDKAIANIDKARRKGCPGNKRDQAQAAADSGSYGSVDPFLAGYLGGYYSSGSSPSSCGGTTSSCGSSSPSSCGSSCGGGGCGGGGCGGS